MAEGSGTSDDLRVRIVAAAAKLLAQGGRDAFTTRAVAAAAGVQAPALYRLFGDKGGLLDAVAAHGFAAYLREKEDRAPCPDPVEDLRHGWDLHVGFGLANPALYALMYGDPRSGVTSPAADAGFRVLKAHIRRIALAGRLRMHEERAARLVHASGCGTVLTLLAQSEANRDVSLSADAREAAMAAIATEAPARGSSTPVSVAVALRADLKSAAKILTSGERQVLEEWLDRIIAGA